MGEEKLTYVWGQKSGVVFFFFFLMVFVGYGSNGDG